MQPKMMVIVAHMGDFIFQCGGAIAKYADQGHEVHVIVLSYGSKSEAKDYWRGENATIDGCDTQRRKEGLQAAEILGVSSIEFCEYEDALLSMGKDRIDKLATAIRRIRPDFIVTHNQEDDPFNPDHNMTRQSVMTAYQTASGAGYVDDCPVAPRQTPIFGLEPFDTELSHFSPKIYIDISTVMEKKISAMQVCQSQKRLNDPYIKRAELRAAQCAANGNNNCKFAEVFSSFGPIAKHGYFVW